MLNAREPVSADRGRHSHHHTVQDTRRANQQRPLLGMDSIRAGGIQPWQGERERVGVSGSGAFWGNARVRQELMEATKQPLGLEVKIWIS